MAISSSDKELMSDINVTPFVDVMLVLLIIFMVTAPMMTQGVDVTLPQASSESLPADNEQIIVTVDKESRVYINDYQVSIDFLQERLNQILKGRKNRQIYLRADKDIPYGSVVRVMSEIKDAGISKIGMITVPLEEKPNQKASEKKKTGS